MPLKIYTKYVQRTDCNIVFYSIAFSLKYCYIVLFSKEFHVIHWYAQNVLKNDSRTDSRISKSNCFRRPKCASTKYDKFSASLTMSASNFPLDDK